MRKKAIVKEIKAIKKWLEQLSATYDESAEQSTEMIDKKFYRGKAVAYDYSAMELGRLLKMTQSVREKS
jgi:hypothetical protein